MKQMPSFDEWGLRPAGLRGPRKNPVAVVALPVAQSGPVSGDGAGRQEPPGVEGDDVEVLMPHGAPKAASPEARPGAVAGEESRPTAPEVGAPEDPVVPHEAAHGGVPQAGPLSADRLDASSMPQTDPYAKCLGRFGIDFETLRKRKEALGGNDHRCRLLKRRKYFAMDE